MSDGSESERLKLEHDDMTQEIVPDPNADQLAKPWRPQFIADSDGKWYGNQLRFATAREALDWAHDLWVRWTLVRAYRTFNEVTGEVIAP